MDPAQPISIILDGSNYILWAQAMRSFIKGKKLWRYLTGDITIPVQTAASRRSSSSSFQQECRYGHEFGHKTVDCPVRPCRLCRKIGTGHFPKDCPRNPEKWSKNTSSTSAPPKQEIQYRFKPPSQSAAAAADDDDVLNNSSSSALSVNDVAEIVKQIMSNSGTPSSSALSVTSGNSSWYFDSGCCNHMTSDPFSFVSKQHMSHYPLIHTVDGCHMPVNHVGHVSTSTLSLPDTYFIPSLKLNLISVGQLCDLGFDLHFSHTGCCVQDPETGQTIGMGRKVGRLFELINLSIPHRPMMPPQSATSVTSQHSLELWHSRLGSDLDGISNLKQYLNHHFEMKDLGTLRYFLGLEVSTTSDGYYLSQTMV
ncbi:hypothetical protein RJ639_019499 [Escallonia herrerae]|uniref:Gag-pol polyprotein n=1 Tax=Escallonia herrerae TaxID=1293975 RepID=A0AA88V8G5_9ASTE|nr:hypothetical protein RJ639_019499 [Escallonia herrerae]